MSDKRPLSNRAFAAKVMPDIWRILKSGQTSPFFGQFLGGPYVQEFEKEFARYVGTKYAVTVANGTLALNAAYTALFCETPNTQPEAIVSPYTFVATVTELMRSGYTPVFADVDLNSGCIDMKSVRSLITEKTGLIVPMYPLGSHPDLSDIMNIEPLVHGTYATYPHEIPVVEDACQSLGPNFKLRGRMAAFSFQQTKSLSTGEGGIVVTDWEEGYDRLCYIRNMGCKYGPLRDRYAHIMSTNYRLTEIQAAIGLHALKDYDKVIKHQLTLGKILLESIQKAPWLWPQQPWSSNGYIFGSAVSNIFCDDHCSPPIFNVEHSKAKAIRARFLEKVKRWNKGVPGKVIGGGYSEVVYQLPAFRAYERKEHMCPVAEMWRDHAVWFDIRGWSEEQVKGIARAVEKFRP